MNQLQFDLSLAGADLMEAQRSLRDFDEAEFQEWAKQFDKLPEAILRIGWAARVKERRENNLQ